MCLTSILIVTDGNISVKAAGEHGDSNPLDLEFIYSVTENLSNGVNPCKYTDS
jgi:hypothetical protein